MTYGAVIFDLDGTLLNTIKDLADSVNTGLNHLGFPQHELEDYRYFVGDGREALAARALPENYRDPASVGKLIQYINDEYPKRWAENTRPYQGIPDLLDALTNTGIKMAILTNKPHDSTELMVSRLLPQWRFEIILGAGSSLPMKPDPAGALQIARRLDIRPEEFLYLGDSGVDMKTATAAEMYPVGVLWGLRTAGELLDNGAKTLIEHPAELLHLL